MSTASSLNDTSRKLLLLKLMNVTPRNTAMFVGLEEQLADSYGLVYHPMQGKPKWMAAAYDRMIAMDVPASRALAIVREMKKARDREHLKKKHEKRLKNSWKKLSRPPWFA